MDEISWILAGKPMANYLDIARKPLPSGASGRFNAKV